MTTTHDHAHDLVLFAGVATLADAVLRADRGADGPAGGGKGEENTYGLPQGGRIKKSLLEWFAEQRKQVLGTIPPDLTELPSKLPDLSRDDEKMAADVTPALAVYWDESGKKTRERLGLDPGEWRVTNPHTKAKIEKAALDFCSSTNATTSHQLGAALAKLRRELVNGVVNEGDSLRELTRRVQSVFDRAEQWRAGRIAATEASRAVHAAQEQAAAESGVVAGLELLLSADACPLCRRIATECKRVPLGRPFAVIGSNPVYAAIKYPPLHPGCQCTAIEVLTPEAGGPSDPDWGKTVVQPKGGDYTPPEGKKVPGPEPERLKNPPKPKPQPTAQPQPTAVDAAPAPASATATAPEPQLSRPGLLPPPDLDALKTVEERLDAAAKYVESFGVKVERRGHDVLAGRLTPVQLAGCAGAYLPGKRTVYFNDRDFYWKDPALWVRKQAERGWTSTAESGHVATHELAHALHHREIGDRFRPMVKGRMTKARKAVAAKVSLYARTDPAEFVAETFTGLASGVDYPADVMKLYRALGGPEP